MGCAKCATPNRSNHIRRCCHVPAERRPIWRGRLRVGAEPRGLAALRSHLRLFLSCLSSPLALAESLSESLPSRSRLCFFSFFRSFFSFLSLLCFFSLLSRFSFFSRLRSLSLRSAFSSFLSFLRKGASGQEPHREQALVRESRWTGSGLGGLVIREKEEESAAVWCACAAGGEHAHLLWKGSNTLMFELLLSDSFPSISFLR